MMARATLAETSSDTPERILRAALEACSENGFDGATTRDIAARAGVPLGLLQYHFVYILAGSAGVILHQAQECKRLSGVYPSNPEVVNAHARAVEHLFLGPPNQEMTR